MQIMLETYLTKEYTFLGTTKPSSCPSYQFLNSLQDAR